MSVATPELATRLEERLEGAVRKCFHDLAGIEARTVTVDDQQRHHGSTLTCTTTLIGDGWLGQLVLLMPDEMGREIGARLAGLPEGPDVKRANVADGLGALGAGIGLGFGRSFSGEGQITVGMPIVIGGSSMTVMFSWGRHFETRLSFQSMSGPFWVILRLSHTRADADADLD